MTSLMNNEDDFQPEINQPIEEVSDDFEADDFEPEKPKEKKYNDLSWYEKTFTREGQQLQAKKNRGVAKSLVSGATAGYSQLIPGLKIEEEEKDIESTAQEIAGSLLPLGAATKGLNTVLKAASYALPKYAKTLTTFGNLLGIGVIGGVYEGLEESAEKSLETGEFVPPSIDTMIKQGAKWVLMDGVLKIYGWGDRFAKGLFKKSTELEMPVNKVLEMVTDQTEGTEKITQKALSILENKPVAQIEAEMAEVGAAKQKQTQLLNDQVAERKVNLKDRKISQQDFTKLETSAEPKPYLPQEFQAENIIEETLSTDLTQRVDDIAQRAPNSKQLGENIMSDIKIQVENHKKETDLLYDVAKKGENTSVPKTRKTANAIVEQLKKIEGEGISLTPEGYNKARNQLLDTLDSLGYELKINKSGQITGIKQVSKPNLSKVVDVKKRLNSIINYDLIDTSAQDFLKKPAHELRGEIRTGYGPKNSKERKAFEKAEEMFGEFAEKKNKRSIRAIQTSQKPESIANTIMTPSGLADVKAITSPEQFAQVEREVVENMRGMSEQKAKDFYREIRPSLTESTRNIAEEIIESKTPKGSASRKAAQREAIQNKALDDIAKATITGERPEVALNLWKTTEGQQLITNAVKDNPNKKQVLNYLQEQSFKDFYSSFVAPDGKIDFKKFNSLMKDPATVNNIKMLHGQESVDFLNNLEQLSNRIQKNNSIIEGKINKGSAKERKALETEIKKHGEERLSKIKDKNIAKQEAMKLSEESGLLYKFDDLLNSYGVKAKGLIAALGLYTMGPVATTTMALSYEVFKRLVQNKKVQSAFKKAAVPNSSPVSLLRTFTEVLDEVEEED